MIKITFLGTGTSQGIPIMVVSTQFLSDDPKDNRLRVSISLAWEDYFFVIDCGQILGNRC